MYIQVHEVQTQTLHYYDEVQLTSNSVYIQVHEVQTQTLQYFDEVQLISNNVYTQLCPPTPDRKLIRYFS